MNDVPEFYHYLEVVGHKYEQSILNWTLWEPDFKEVEKLP